MIRPELFVPCSGFGLIRLKLECQSHIRCLLMLILYMQLGTGASRWNPNFRTLLGIASPATGSRQRLWRFQN